jgi:hypothetical protein
MRVRVLASLLTVLAIIVSSPDVLNGQTESSLQGTVKEVLSQRGVGDGTGTHLLVATRNGAVEVCLGPSRFLEANHVMPQVGDSIVVKGHPVTSANGELFLATSLASGGRTFALRNPTGKPRWSGCGHDCGRVGNCDQQQHRRHGQEHQ